jgi:hypothetical protein
LCRGEEPAYIKPVGIGISELLEIPGYRVEGLVHETRHLRYLRGIRLQGATPVLINVPAEAEPDETDAGVTVLDRLHRIFHAYETGRRVDHPNVARYVDVVPYEESAAWILEHADASVLRGAIPALLLYGYAAALGRSKG